MIFNSSKKLVIHTTADVDSVKAALTARIKPEPATFDIFAWASVGIGTFLGKADGRDFTVRYISGIRNSLQPVMHVHVETATTGGTVVLARFSSSVFVQVFFILWMLGASSPTIFSLAHGTMPPGMLGIFPFFGLFVLLAMRGFGSMDESKLENMVRDAVMQAENRPTANLLLEAESSRTISVKPLGKLQAQEPNSVAMKDCNSALRNASRWAIPGG